MNDKNMLLGYGETLTAAVELKKGGGGKNKPYTYNENKPVIMQELATLIAQVDTIPPAALADGKAVAKFVLHPSFLAKSYFPVGLLNKFSLSSIGSKAVKIKPRKDIKKRGRKEEYTTACIYVSGEKKNFKSFLTALETDALNKGQKDDFITLESITLFNTADKIKKLDGDKTRSIEVALHTPDDDLNVIESFVRFATSQGAHVEKERSIKVKGLTFLPIIATKKVAEEVAQFSFLRTLRDLPQLRVSEPVLRQILKTNFPLALPPENAINQNLKVAIFDGGLGIDDFNKWVTEFTFNEKGTTSAQLLSHGQDVTSTILFGALTSDNKNLNIPYCNVDHYRVLDSTISNADVDLFDVLIRIKSVLDSQHYDYINLSLGPRLPVDDDDVHVWTSTLEEILSNGKTLCTIAVGNDGELPEGLNRIQPPADLVNGLSIGAATSTSDDWEKCHYSCIGPGRSPGFVKPDGVAFGGSEDEPFKVFSPVNGGLAATAGTSFSAPLVLRQAIALSSTLQYDITPLTAKALLIHHAESSDYDRAHVGWGRFPNEISDVIYCSDSEVKVIYQGTLKPSQYMRAPIPFPDIEIPGEVKLRATFCFSTPVDAEHPLNYTRSGLEVIMRKGTADGTGMTFPLFNLKNVYADEGEQRSDAHKWETTLRSEHTFKKDELTSPCFDVIYYGRDCGMPVETDDLEDLPYVLIVSLSAEEMPDLYNEIRQKYQTLQPIQVQQQIILRT
ncbi:MULTISPECIES: S8 family peptidase [Serratia]|uniref:S8 family peptidase n=1 Tax=Serratia TaxID=613 RepID=UPI0029D435E0|nr:S8 family peptidase [Serratia marcescens]MDX7543768.1 S8 family peptidase [Serratia marcescens]MDX7565401.1 S8 family peptidase [Serratia marcescens]